MKTLLMLLLITGTAWAATYTGLNFSNMQPPLKDGDVLISCNLQQERPHTQIAEGVRGLTFRLCNLENCDVPPDARVEDCLVVHMDSVAVLTITAAEYDKRQADVAAATKAAETIVLAQPVKVDLAETVTVAAAIEDAEQRKAVAVSAALTTLTAACEAKDKISLAGCTPKPNIDPVMKQIVSWTYWRRVQVP